MRYRRIVQIALVMLAMMVSGVASAQDKTYVIGDLILIGDVGFKAEMTQMGYIEGQNITYLYPVVDTSLIWGSPEYMTEYNNQVEAMADKVDVFVTNADSDAIGLQQLVGTNVPIVFARSDDPVATGAVKDLITPGGMITGIVTNRHHERRLQIATEIKPTTKRVYYINSQYSMSWQTVLQQFQTVANDLGVEVVVAQLSNDPASAEEVIRNMPEEVDWIFLAPFALIGGDEFAAACRERKAGIAWIADLTSKDYLMSYGPSMDATGAQAAQIVDRILRGASPADLPVQTAENVLMINLEAADAIGLEIPVSILRQADTIIRPGYWDNRDAFGNLITPTPDNTGGN